MTEEDQASIISEEYYTVLPDGKVLSASMSTSSSYAKTIAEVKGILVANALLHPTIKYRVEHVQITRSLIDSSTLDFSNTSLLDLVASAARMLGDPSQC